MKKDILYYECPNCGQKTYVNLYNAYSYSLNDTVESSCHNGDCGSQNILTIDFRNNHRQIGRVRSRVEV